MYKMTTMDTFPKIEKEKEEYIPKTIFIIPYRNRKEQMFFFSNYMGSLLKDDKTVEFYFSHQNDERPFSRGATKNIGFIVMKNKYPDHYKDINFVFNDVDTVPYNNIFSYKTEVGKVCHYYGFTHSLGGIVVIKGSDFEMINGYPCLYTWGREDFILQQRCEQNNLFIDRTHFYKIGSPEILQLFDGVSRIVNPNEIRKTANYDPTDGIFTIYNLYFTIDKQSKNPKDEGFLVENDKMFVINILNFNTKYSYNVNDFNIYDLRSSEKEVMNSSNKKAVSFADNNWTDIPYKQTTREKLIVHQQQQQLFHHQRNRNIHQNNMTNQHQHPHHQQRVAINGNGNPINVYNNGGRPISATELYSKKYGAYYGKQNASKSVNIRLGGL